MATTGPSAPNANWQLKDVVTSGRGAKSAQLAVSGQPLSFQLGSKGQELVSPWGAGVFGGDTAEVAATRLSIDWSLPNFLEAQLSVIDEWAVGYITKHCERLLKKKLTLDTVKANYKPLVKPHEGYAPTVRTKFNVGGRHGLRCWDAHGQPRELPEDWRGLPCVLRATLSHLWLMGTSFGFVLCLTDAQVSETRASCPFQVEAPEEEEEV